MAWNGFGEKRCVGTGRADRTECGQVVGEGGVMESRFQELPLEGLVSFKTGKLNSNAAKPDGTFPFFTCSQETYRTDTWSFDGEYVLLAGNNAAGIYPLKYFNGKFDAYQRTYAIRSINQKKLFTRYLYYALRLQLELMKNISTGVATKFLTLTLLNQTRIPVPPSPRSGKSRRFSRPTTT
jgi:type I restriction enzyme S subunit